VITAYSIIGEIAATHPLSTRVFARHRIDYCCPDPARFEAIEKTLHMLAADLESHMQKEETVLFPLIEEGSGYMADGSISVMEVEHDDAGRMLESLRKLTNDYVPPDDACNTWRGLWAGLADLERSLHEHIHLENNILHRRALEE
jgi:regulator of cell morphogenesis and NO signaling